MTPPITPSTVIYYMTPTISYIELYDDAREQYVHVYLDTYVAQHLASIQACLSLTYSVNHAKGMRTATGVRIHTPGQLEAHRNLYRYIALQFILEGSKTPLYGVGEVYDLQNDYETYKYSLSDKEMPYDLRIANIMPITQPHKKSENRLHQTLDVSLDTELFYFDTPTPPTAQTVSYALDTDRTPDVSVEKIKEGYRLNILDTQVILTENEYASLAAHFTK